MALFRRRTATVLKKSTTEGDVVEERKTFRIAGQTVEVRRVEDPPEKTTGERAQKKTQKKPDRSKKRTGKSGGTPRSRGRTNGRAPSEEEIIIPTDVGRRQMLVRSAGAQTQIVVLEGPVLVEHYVAQPDRTSMVGNIYLAKVRNVLPGMEASFLDFGAAKNGVLYASDVAYDRKKHRNGPPRIEESLAEGDEVLVQVVKDPMGAKGARLTGTPSLPGRYLVLVPDSDSHGISRRLPEEERNRLRTVIDQVKPDGFGVIVRTAALHASAEEIAADISRLVKAWEEITLKAKDGGAPRAVYTEPDLLIRVIREHFTADFRRMLIEDKDAYESVVAYLRATAPDLVSKVQMYEDELALFERYHVDDQLRKALERRVYLPSGGHLVIDRTEALTVIDVNTGKFVGSSSLEETVLQNNLEAAEEIGRQLRLRDIGGIIVIDFIDMEKERNQQQVLRRLRETLAKDKTRTQVFDVSHLGLVEMTRKNVSAGLLEHFSEPCPHCEGRGVLLHEEAVKNGLPVLTTVETE
ncbi:MAG TPA: Rne/Rng family ribonuclease [Acidimicrobiia bacterium]|nr:Rne/Rng family ribonuclease [Acidimicrobiia bacterium]